ncbi:MAG: ABC transporter ATP-binding protein [Betaproteobacteria bacterium AqS2]|uniref:ABC transporter ATP-binding protein n=1 Tax=Candidatus Amphirhobacter heronislandensis TaxID=1732024 RepID=A0A930UHH7_9GAMM|nr:ABC transporter ATP-binding protein [Betaproteobacteria bacterium AqS2]
MNQPAAASPPRDAAPAIELKGICKAFGPVQANQDVSLSVEAGSIHGIVGENGAGKSTLMSILYGFYEADSGSIEVKGKPAAIEDSADAIGLGIGMVHQHFMLVPVFSVLENVMLGVEGGALLAPGKRRARKEIARIGEDYGLKLDPDELIENLPVGVRQRVEIVKALYRGAEILILDEPTGVLTPQEADALFDILRTLKERGETVILITHKLREIMAVTDRVSVMRGGKLVATRETAATNPAELAELMVGRKVLLQVDKQPREPAEVRLAAEGLTVVDGQGVERVKDVSFSVRAGEIVGVAGVSGNGQDFLLEALAGIRAPARGTISILDLQISPERPADPAEVRRHGAGHVPEDRHAMGLVMNYTAEHSLMLGYHRHPRFRRSWLLDAGAIRRHAARVLPEYDVRPAEPRLRSADFSGGNQQKIVLAREMDEHPQVLLVGQPTRGVDIGAIEAIHRRILALRLAGCAILLVSFELDEIMSLADRIIVMNAGEIVGTVAAEGADDHELGLMMAGIRPGEQKAA